MSSSSTALNVSPPYAVPRLVRGKIGRSSTSEYASFSMWGMETCRYGIPCMRADKDIREKHSKKENAVLTRT
jgi:hypothetical protein